METCIRCKKCGSLISANTDGEYIPCACGAIAVDGNGYYTRVIGDMGTWEFVTTLARALVDYDMAKGFAEVRRYVAAKSVFVNDKLATSWDQTVKTGDCIKLGKHKSFVLGE